MMASTSARRHMLEIAIICGCLIAMITFGVRTSFGLFTAPLSTAYGWERDVYSLAMALQNLCWGLGLPIAGALCDRFGAARVLAGGAILYAAGTALMGIVDTPVLLYVTGGLMVGFGVAGASFTIVIAALARMVPPEKRSWAMGIGTAAGSLGQCLFSPLGQVLIGSFGWQDALLILAGCIALVPVLSLAFGGGAAPSGPAPAPSGGPVTFRAALKEAFQHPSYRFLVAGFFVCGFHIAFILIHLPAHLQDQGVSPTVAAWGLGLIGAFNVIGSYASGVLGGRMSRRWLLSSIYLARSLLILGFVLLPPSPLVVYAFGALIGLLWLSTVPPTSSLVATMFGTRYLATLFGIAMLSHQIGAFIGVQLGGWAYTNLGSYDLVWWIAIALGVLAALVHLPIVEKPAPRMAAPAPA